MQSEVNMPSPICLIENTLEGELMVRQEAINILSEITQPLVVVAIVGLYRTGKSYLMNKLAGKNKGFSLGSTIQSHTKGIWMWCVPHPKKSNHTLVLLDTEGLGDVEKGDSNNDNWIFSLAILLSSTFVYNSMGTIDQRALEQLHYVTELSKYIRVKTPKSNKSHKNVEDSADFMSFFPNFIWTVRDFTLDLEFNDKPITADQYLENALQLLKGSSPKVAQLNLPRECIRFFFPGRKCFVFDRPASKKNLKRLEELHEDDLEPDFVVQTQKFCQYVLNESRTKTIHSGHPVSGKLLANLAVTYVDAIRSGAVPCIENTVISLSHIENSAAVEEAVSHYQKQMKERGKFPTATIKVFLDLHAACEKEAIKIFMKRSFKDDDQKYQAQLGGLIKLKAEQFCAENEQASIDICKALLEQVFRHTQKKIAEGFYSRPGGYLLFMDAQKEVTEKCKRTPGRGLKADEVIQQFRQEQQSVAITILQMAQNLSKKEKEFAKEQARAKSAQQEMKLKEEMHAAAQLKLETQLKSHKEHTRQLTEKLEEDMQKMQEEHYRVMTQKLMEQDLLHQEGAHQQHKKMQAEIQRLQTQMDAAKQPKKRDNCVIL